MIINSTNKNNTSFGIKLADNAYDLAYAPCPNYPERNGLVQDRF